MMIKNADVLVEDIHLNSRYSRLSWIQHSPLYHNYHPMANVTELLKFTIFPLYKQDFDSQLLSLCFKTENNQS